MVSERGRRHLHPRVVQRALSDHHCAHVTTRTKGLNSPVDQEHEQVTARRDTQMGSRDPALILAHAGERQAVEGQALCFKSTSVAQQIGTLGWRGYTIGEFC